MSKPTLFFSHSSKDKDMVLAIKNKVMQYTSGTIEIFQSSDGASIPLGTNWVHKVEAGLDDAKVMFVFVTEKSISSGWIYFEAGYAYSKKIRVIPVGVGVNVGDLKAPLNLLQGFNISSAGSLNNFITIINDVFDYKFQEQFTEADFDEVVALSSPSYSHNIKFEKVVRSIRFSIAGIYYEKPGEQKKRDTQVLFERIKQYLDKQNYDYSLGRLYRYDKGKSLAIQGIKIDYEPDRDGGPYGEILVSISPYNFEKSFQLYLEISEYCLYDYATWVHLRLQDDYEYVSADEDCAALLLGMPDWFSLSKTEVGSFDCNKLNLDFAVFDAHTKREADMVLALHYNAPSIKAHDITILTSKLYELGLIYKKVGGTNNA